VLSIFNFNGVIQRDSDIARAERSLGLKANDVSLEPFKQKLVI